jgi:glyoxylase-like metal-dependent hydrolase (beta-lactamase superfamily II)
MVPLNRAMIIDSFTGGMFETNCFFLPETGILIDAPQESADWLAEQGHEVKLLLLTHGHMDHVWDAARIHREHHCVVGCHPETVPMVSDPEFFRRFGFALEVETLAPELMITATAGRDLGGVEFQVLEVPGHCPGSLVFFSNAERLAFGGDVLFAGGVGRWDLPGGDKELLFTGIRTKLFPLGDDVKILPGHGPVTTIGRERASNAFVGEG